MRDVNDELAVGQQVRLSWSPGAAHVFSANGESAG